ncbi:hypothetical protein HMPREF2767_05325 [Nosocomiicoccus sp. HMSC067E10]|uniref:hypothetical protein n=1 Tax=Nosocomiicoccus sp. HMSC067E10 TaxID=1739271 RepID=UPI0008A54BBD|nr:hypothetical protein [Nosocomiicoccus sp. HMSC067E10]OFL46331.1 hypothetical protein HMPREF2767_05325 [Nosocomiicoccus sp. HMSC067E10]
MSFKHFLVAGAASTLLLTACNTDDNKTSEKENGTEETATTESNESVVKDVDVSENDLNEAIEYDGEYGKYVITRIDTIDIEPSDEEKEADENATAKKAVVIEYEFTNKSSIPTAGNEAFALDLAVRQFSETGMIATDNLTLDIPENSEYHALVNDSTKTLQTDESTKAVVAYGPVDPDENEVKVQSREDESLLDLVLKFK